jgi:hypothetical protein
MGKLKCEMAEEIQRRVCIKLSYKILELMPNLFNGKEATVNKTLDGSTYPS